MSVVKALYGKTSSNHASALDYFNKNKLKFASTYSFAITRNPYTRLYSAYNYLTQGGMNFIDRAWYSLYLEKYESFEKFVLNGGLKTAIEKNAEHFIPQYKFIYDTNHIKLCTYVGKFEFLSDVEKELSIKTGKEIHFTNQNVMNKNKFDISSKYNLEMLDIVNKYYAKDFELLEYDKE
jgi:hypothetical protein